MWPFIRLLCYNTTRLQNVLTVVVIVISGVTYSLMPMQILSINSFKLLDFMRKKKKKKEEEEEEKRKEKEIAHFYYP